MARPYYSGNLRIWFYYAYILLQYSLFGSYCCHETWPKKRQNKLDWHWYFMLPMKSKHTNVPKNVLQFLLIFAHAQSSPSGYPGMTATLLHSMMHAVCKVPRMRQNQIQRMKVHHFSYITLLKLQHILGLIWWYCKSMAFKLVTGMSGMAGMAPFRDFLGPWG